MVHLSTLRRVLPPRPLGRCRSVLVLRGSDRRRCRCGGGGSSEETTKGEVVDDCEGAGSGAVAKGTRGVAKKSVAENVPSSSFFTSYLMPSNRFRRLSFLRFNSPKAVESSLAKLEGGGWDEEIERIGDGDEM